MQSNIPRGQSRKRVPCGVQSAPEYSQEGRDRRACGVVGPRLEAAEWLKDTVEENPQSSVHTAELGRRRLEAPKSACPACTKP